MQLKYVFEGRLREHLEQQTKDVARAVTLGMKEVMTKTQNDFRQQVLSNFKRTPPYARRHGQNIDKATSAKGFPNRTGKFSLNAAGVMRALPTFMDSFTQDTTISGRGNKLVIALPTAKRKTLERSWQPSRKGGAQRYRKYSDIKGAERLFGKLLRIPLKGNAYLLAADKKRAAAKGLRTRRRGQNFVPLFLVQKQVSVPRKFDFVGPTQRAQSALPAAVEKYFKPKK